MKRHPDYSRCLFTSSHAVFATWVRDCEQVVADANSPDETRWLYNRINEAVTAWRGFAEDRLMILVRRILGVLLTDDEVTEALAEIPSWWRKTASGSDGESDGSPAME